MDSNLLGKVNGDLICYSKWMDSNLLGKVNGYLVININGLQ